MLEQKVWSTFESRFVRLGVSRLCFNWLDRNLIGERFGRVSKLYWNWVGRLVGGVGNGGVLGGLDGQGVDHGVLGQRDGAEVGGEVNVGGVLHGKVFR